MAEEPSNGELARRIDAGFGDLKEDMRDLAKRLDSKVDTGTLALQQQAQDERHAALAGEVKSIRDARQKEAEDKQLEGRAREVQRAADKRLIFTALVAPVLLLLLQVYLATKGAGG